MSDQNWPPSGPQGNGTDPAEGEQPAQGDSTPPAPGGYTPPPGGYTPPAPGSFTPPPYPEQPSYPPAQSFGQQPTGYPSEPVGFPPQEPYTQQPGYPPQGYAPVGPTGPTLGGAVLADWPKRALGGVIDFIVPSIVISIVLAVIPNDALRSSLSSLLGIAWWVYLGYKNGTTGVTLGKSIAKLKVVGEASGEPIGVANGIIRQFAHLIDSAICLIGWLFPLWDSKRQTIADKVMRTVVVDNSADPDAGKYTWWP